LGKEAFLNRQSEQRLFSLILCHQSLQYTKKLLALLESDQQSEHHPGTSLLRCVDSSMSFYDMLPLAGNSIFFGCMNLFREEGFVVDGFKKAC